MGKFDPNDPNSSGKGARYDPNDPNSRKGSRYDPDGRKGSGYVSNDADSRRGSGYDPNDPNALRRGSRMGSGSVYDPNDPNSRKGSRYDPNDPNLRKGSRYGPDGRKISGYVSNDDPASSRRTKRGSKDDLDSDSDDVRPAYRDLKTRKDSDYEPSKIRSYDDSDDDLTTPRRSHRRQL